MNKLFGDLKTDEEKSNFFLSGRGYETGIIAQAIQNDVAMAYHRCAEYRKELEALQSQPSHAGWKEAAIAWEVCASLHREFCKGRDPLFKVRQSDFVKHAEDARTRALETEALQSQDAEDAAQAEWMVDDGRAPWAINSLKDRIKEMRASEKRCRNAFRKDYMRVVSVYFADALGEAAEALEKRLSVIDHARRIEGDGNG